MCMRQHSTPLEAISPAISGSPRRALTSLTICAPAPIAAAATDALEVSIDTRTPSAASARRSSTGSTRASSCRAPTGSAPGRVDSPPTSRMSAPSRASVRQRSSAASGSRCSPPSEKESGVTLTTPMTLKERNAPGPAAAAKAPALERLGPLGFARAQLGGAAGEPGPRQRARCFALGPVGRRRRRGQLRRARALFDAEDLLLALALEQREELLLLDRLALDE